MNLKSENKMELLKRKNRRNNLMKELEKHIRIPNEPFFEVDVNTSFCKRVFERINLSGDKHKIQGLNHEETVELSKDYLIAFIKDSCINKEFARLLFYREREIEAMKVHINDVTNNINVILEILKFMDGYADFILIDDNFSFGICVERTEYFYEFCSWGIK
ncbi:group-specific protein [Clostridium estertheticum]|uniref:YxiF family protein n=1 Tax=Clostridium estertheticum TaxID=238834 RepID=UPI001C7CC931|nr:group-specific protein [Clostridium estertheticum]MBX4262813.1 group-specific protein [Clostridium estertheticum]WLC72247.1 group-specific protein [Clostridium estertheticum]